MFKIWVFWSNILPCVACGLMTEVMIGQKKVHNGSTEPAGLRSSVGKDRAMHFFLCQLECNKTFYHAIHFFYALNFYCTCMAITSISDGCLYIFS